MSLRLAIPRLLFLVAAGPLLTQPPAWADPPEPAVPPAAPVVPATLRPLDQLREGLALTPQQLPLWQAFAGRLDAWTQLHYRERPVPSEGTEAPRQFAHLVDLQQNRLAALEDIERAAADLYAVLTPEQRKQADQRMLATIPVFATSAPMASGATPASGTWSRRGPPEGGGPPGGRRSGGF